MLDGLVILLSIIHAAMPACTMSTGTQPIACMCVQVNEDCWHRGQVDGMKASMDADADGTVTKAEFHALLHGEL